MPYDPSLPLDSSTAKAAIMRAQLQALFDLIQAITQVSAAQVDAVNTLNPGDPADVTLMVNGNTLHFTFGIPRGADGTPGTDGSNGLDGNDGGPGPPGPSVAGSVVDAVNTIDPGNAATVETSFDGSNVHFTFNIPRGQDGPAGSPGNNGTDGQNGNNGSNGMDGAPGPSVANSIVDAVNSLTPGDPATVVTSFDGTFVHFTFGIPRGADGTPGSNGANGEVSNADLASAISGTSSNSNGVSTLGLSVSDPPTQSEVQQIANKLDELINALRR